MISTVEMASPRAPAPSSAPYPRWVWLLSALFGCVFLALTFSAAAARGFVAEETQPFLARHPVVLEHADAIDEDFDENGSSSPFRIAKMPPYEPNAPKPPRWIATSQWPVVAYAGERRTYPVFIRGHQSALGSYPGILFGPLLGNGMDGPRHMTALLAFLIVLLTPLMAFRLGASKWAALLATATVSLSFGMISIASTSYSFEVASRTLMMASLYTLASPRPFSKRRAALAGLLAALAILCRATIGAALFPAMLILLVRHSKHSSSRLPRASLGLLSMLSVILPMLIVFISHRLLPFRAGTAPLADFPIDQIPGRLLVLPRMALVTLAFLGDASRIWAPISLGSLRLSSQGLWAPAWLAGLVFISALYRILKRRAGWGEQLYLWTMISSILAGAVLYGNPDQFQLAMAIEPLLALALGEQIASIFSNGQKSAGMALLTSLLLARAHGLYMGLAVSARDNQNPMFSAKAQRAAIAAMRALGIQGPELLTTVYNHAGVIEAWTGGLHETGGKQVIRPVHAWPLLTGISKNPNHCLHQAAWRALLQSQKPQFVLLSEGPNLYETGSTDIVAIARSLSKTAELSGISIVDEGHFTTEGQGPGWALVRLVYPASNPLEFKADPACEQEDEELFRHYAGQARRGRRTLAFYGLRVGDPFFQGFILTRIFSEQIKEKRTHLVLSKDTIKIEFELRQVRPGEPPPPVQGGPWGVYYRNRDIEIAGKEALERIAAEIAHLLSAYQPPITEPISSDDVFEMKPGISYVGRFDERDGRFAFPGSQIEIRFEGSGVDIRFADSGGNNRFFVIVDGGAPRLFIPKAGEHAYTIAEHLPPGVHKALIYKKTESFFGAAQFLGAHIHEPGKRSDSESNTPGHPKKTIEIIGDSISCGYGAEGDSPHCPFSADTESEFDSYGALFARSVSADHINICYSGKGVFRDGQGRTNDQMPEIYKRILADQPDSRWDASGYAPDLVLINLGTNDFILGDPGPPFEQAYLNFLRELRKLHPQAHLACALGPMLSGEMLNTARTRILAVTASRKQEGDDKIYFIELPSQRIPEGAGCDVHPNRQTHRIAANVLEKALLPLLIQP